MLPTSIRPKTLPRLDDAPSFSAEVTKAYSACSSFGAAVPCPNCPERTPLVKRSKVTSPAAPRPHWYTLALEGGSTATFVPDGKLLNQSVAWNMYDGMFTG